MSYLYRVGSCSQLAAWRMRAQLEALTALVPELLESGSEIAVHRARVAARRSRSAIRFFGPWLPSAAELVGTEWKWIASRLSPVRDADVLMALVPNFEDLEPLAQSRICEGLNLRRRRGMHSFRHALVSGRFNQMVSNVSEFIDETEGRLAGSENECLSQLKKLRRRADRHLEQALTSGRHSDWHLFRIEIKRVRYAVESLAVIDPDRARKVLQRCEALQEDLGAFQDATMLVSELERNGFDQLVKLDECLESLQQSVPREWLKTRQQLRRFG